MAGDETRPGEPAGAGTAADSFPQLLTPRGAFGADGPAARAAAERAEAAAAPRAAAPAGLSSYAAIPAGTGALKEARAQGFDLRIRAKQDGFRRGGIAHPAEPTLRRSRDFSPAQLEAIAAEPMLQVDRL